MPIRKLSGKKSTASPAAKSPVREKLNLTLPTKLNVPSDNFSDYPSLYFGAKGIGKTSLVAEFERSLIMEWEPGRENLSILQVPQKGEPRLTWPRAKRYIELACDDRRIHTVVTDTIDRCYNACLAQICKERGAKHPTELNDFGKTWNDIDTELEDTMMMVKDAGKQLVFVSHSKFKEIPTRGKNPEMVCPTCSERAWMFMKAACDFAFYYGYRGTQRVIVLRGDETVWAACGLKDHFLDPDSGEPLLEIPVGDSPEQAYKDLLRAFDNKFKGGIIVGQDPDAETEEDKVELPEEPEKSESSKKTKFKKMGK